MKTKNKKTTAKQTSNEMFSLEDGVKTDAKIHEEILNNPEAERVADLAAAKQAAARAKKPLTPKSKAKAKKTAKVNPAAKPTGRDALGGRLGSRMSAINLVVINAGAKGATAKEVIAATGEKPDVVSAQLSDHIRLKRPVTRKLEANGDGKKVFRYFAKGTSPNT